ncbi:CD226 antigen isoform X1 [Prionailurus iriomotensis]
MICRRKMDNQYTLFVAGGTVLSLLFVILMTAVIVISYRRRRRQNRGLFKEHRNKDAQNKKQPTTTEIPSLPISHRIVQEKIFMSTTQPSLID